MAAYAALVSVMHIIEQIQTHPHPPISLHQNQAQSLTQNITFLQDFLQVYSHGQISNGSLESRIADATYAAEDIIESHIVDHILGGSCVGEEGEELFYKGLEKAIQEMDSIKEEVMMIKETMIKIQDDHQRSVLDDGSLIRSSVVGQNAIVGFDEVLEEIMDMLIGRQSSRHIIPVVGMGGIGKTTLVRSVYASRLIVRHFDILAWVTISQEYSMKGILLGVVACVKGQESRASFGSMSGDELGVVLHKILSGRRYLIVLDDMWSIEAWELVKFFFPDNNNGSRIIVTTRLSNVASQLTGSKGIRMRFLDDDQSWNLLCKIVFGEEKGCPLEFEQVGKNIAKSCKGLPLSIVVIGGLLAKSQHTPEYWEFLAQNLTSIVNLEDNERCLRILHMSYNQLSVHLKPCFLYMGSVFPEDSEIRVSWLIKLWVAEGFLKPEIGKSMESVAEEYLKDLIERNLILVHTFASNGKIKLCVIHDFVRDLCLRQAQKEKFVCVIRLQNSLDMPQIDTQCRRVCIQRSTWQEEYDPQLDNPLQSAPLARSLICDFKEVLPSLNTRLLRVLRANDRALYYKEITSLEAIFQVVNLRYIAFRVDWIQISTYLSSLHLLWNLQTLIVFGAWNTNAPSEIWKMPQLRHVEFVMLDLPDPQMDGKDEIVLDKLHTLLEIRNFKCSEEVVKKIPNIKKLGVFYQDVEHLPCFRLDNLVRLDKLESLSCIFGPEEKPIRVHLLECLNFPRSVKRLSLNRTCLNWEDMSEKIGSLPLLEVLKLHVDAFRGAEWETVEGQFCRLRFLLIEQCGELAYWRTESSHFPCLEKLVLRDLDELEEIPWGIGEIPALELIEIKFCSDSAVISAKEIVDEQVGNYGNECGLRVRVHFWEGDQLDILSSPNFQVEIH